MVRMTIQDQADAGEALVEFFREYTQAEEDEANARDAIACILHAIHKNDPAPDLELQSKLALDYTLADLEEQAAEEAERERRAAS